LQGNYEETQKFYRHFSVSWQRPLRRRCRAADQRRKRCFSTLVNWVESGIEPDYVVASQARPGAPPARSACIQNVPVYNGRRQHGRSGELPVRRAEERRPDRHADDWKAIRKRARRPTPILHRTSPCKAGVAGKATPAFSDRSGPSSAGRRTRARRSSRANPRHETRARFSASRSSLIRPLRVM